MLRRVVWLLVMRLTRWRVRCRSLRIHDGPRLVTIALGLSRGPARRDGLCDIEGLWTGMGRERGWREGGERLDPIYAVREGGAPEGRYSPWAQGVDMR